jgi:hypothetical protein
MMRRGVHPPGIPVCDAFGGSRDDAALDQRIATLASSQLVHAPGADTIRAPRRLFPRWKRRQIEFTADADRRITLIGDDPFGMKN